MAIETVVPNTSSVSDPKTAEEFNKVYVELKVLRTVIQELQSKVESLSTSNGTK